MIIVLTIQHITPYNDLIMINYDELWFLINIIYDAL